MAAKKSAQSTPEAKPAKEGGLDLNKAFDLLSKDMEIEAANIQRGSYIANSITSGFLVPDLTLGGGFPGGKFIVLAGLEGGAKSTTTVYGMREAIKAGTYVIHFDYEGSTDSQYAGRLGLRTDWQVEKQNKQPVMYRVYHLDTGEEAFNFMHRILKQLPDAAPGSSIPVMFILDSLPSMLPKAIDMDDEAGGMAMQARMFSTEIKKIRTLLTKKNAILIGVNQLREKPGPSFGDPSYEPCGIAPRQFSDIRLRLSPRSAPKPWSGRIVTEACWDGNGNDTYRHIHINTVKNKLIGLGRGDTWMRLTLTDRGRPGSGFDRVFDTYEYLRLTGQWVKDSGLKGAVTIPGLPYSGEVITWSKFKALIKDPANKADMSTYLPAVCRAQLDSGEGFTRYFDTAGGGVMSSPDEDAEIVPEPEEKSDE